MDEPFFLTVQYKGAERAYEATFQVLGYTHRFNVDIDGTMVIYERDEEGAYRAIIPPEQTGKVPPAELIKALAEEIERILA